MNNVQNLRQALADLEQELRVESRPQAAKRVRAVKLMLLASPAIAGRLVAKIIAAGVTNA